MSTFTLDFLHPDGMSIALQLVGFWRDARLREQLNGLHLRVKGSGGSGQQDIFDITDGHEIIGLV